MQSHVPKMHIDQDKACTAHVDRELLTARDSNNTRDGSAYDTASPGGGQIHVSPMLPDTVVSIPPDTRTMKMRPRDLEE